MLGPFLNKPLSITTLWCSHIVSMALQFYSVVFRKCPHESAWLKALMLILFEQMQADWVLELEMCLVMAGARVGDVSGYGRC